MKDTGTTIDTLELPSIDLLQLSGYQLDRKARTIGAYRWEVKYGQRVRGSITWDTDHGAWQVVFPFRVGMAQTSRATDRYVSWWSAMNQYREHDRALREMVRSTQLTTP